MSLSDLTSRDAVLSAIRQYDELGKDAFLAKYGFRPSRDYWIEFEGRSYDSKAIAGAAFGFQYPDRGPLLWDQFSGGRATVQPILQGLGFTVAGRLADAVSITSQDIALLRASRTSAKYAELTPEQSEAYRRIHGVLENLGNLVLRNLGNTGSYALKLTSGFNPTSGVRGALPKDLWFSVSNSRQSNIGMPQLFMIVSTKGIEYGYAPAIHPNDFSNSDIKQKVRDAAPLIFASLPSADDDRTKELSPSYSRQARI